MLAAIVVYGLKAARSTSSTAPPSVSRWIFLGFMSAFVIKAPLFPFHGWLPDTYREAPPEVTAVLSGVIAKAGALRDVADRDHEVPRADVLLPDGVPRARRDHARLRLDPRVPRADDARRDRVLVARAVRADRARPLLRHEPRLRRRDAADGRARAHLDVALPDRRHGRAADDDGPVRAPRRHGEGPARARDAADDRRRHLARRAGLGVIRGRVPDPRGRLPAAWWWAAIGAGAIVLAAMYMLRAISAVLHEARGSTVTRRRARPARRASSRSSCRSSARCSPSPRGRPASATTRSRATRRRSRSQEQFK